ncbi:uncharacterized protein LMH87_008169 [Akanthomyces muscarius]|uniref:Heme haloperoxidase family profile domain-containing protein n=1 Tax=Akanthomyces muscarius TaxID=2231603 RepID=A0A9W8QI66_AKAMU|nr:uncharacterized protein LMH87_008169 [Akanthomyces muscarius]KAJ4159262.1 hypothetical protein LMH87_008169 [Akanthomyces muscarius]
MMFNEHDVSYSRNDAFLGDNARFNQTVWDQSLKELKPEMLTPTDFAKARQARAEDTFARNTNTTFSFFDMALSSTETSFFFTVFGSGRKTSKSMIRYFIENERLPVALGWLPRLNTNAASVALLIPEVLLGMPKIWAKLGSQTLDVLNLKTFLTLINQRIATGDMLGYLDSFKSVLDDENADSSSVSRLADLIKSAA